MKRQTTEHNSGEGRDEAKNEEPRLSKALEDFTNDKSIEINRFAACFFAQAADVYFVRLDTAQVKSDGNFPTSAATTKKQLASAENTFGAQATRVASRGPLEPRFCFENLYALFYVLAKYHFPSDCKLQMTYGFTLRSGDWRGRGELIHNGTVGEAHAVISYVFNGETHFYDPTKDCLGEKEKWFIPCSWMTAYMQKFFSAKFFSPRLFKQQMRYLICGVVRADPRVKALKLVAPSSFESTFEKECTYVADFHVAQQFYAKDILLEDGWQRSSSIVSDILAEENEDRASLAEEFEHLKNSIKPYAIVESAQESIQNEWSTAERVFPN